VLALAALACATVAPAASAAVPDAAVPDRPPARGVSAPVPAPSVTVRLASLAPTVATPNHPVKVTGSIHNEGRTPLAAPRVRALLRTDGLVGRDQVSAWAAGSDEIPVGPEVASQDLKTALAPGATAGFTLTIPAAALRNNAPYSALPLALDVRSASSQGSAGSLHTFLPWYREKQFTRLSVAWLVPLTLDPDPALFGPPGARRSQAWKAAIGPGSRLDRLMSATDGTPVTWAVDPALLGPPGPPAPSGATAPPGTPIATPTTAPSDTGVTAPTPDAVTTLTSSLATRLRDAAPRHTLWALPYADPDLAATTSLAPGDPTLASLMATPNPLPATVGSAVRGDIAWPADGRWSTQRESQLRKAYTGTGLTAAVVSGSAVGGNDIITASAGRKSPGGLPLLAYDDRLSRLLARTSSAADGPAVVQHFLADTITLLQESPSAPETSPRRVLVAAPRGFSGDPASLGLLLSAVGSAPWLSQSATTGVLHDAVDAEATPRVPGTVLNQPSLGADDPLNPAGSPLTRQALADLPSRRDAITGVSSVLDDPAYKPAWLDATTQLLSTRWRGRPQSWAQLDSAIGKASSVLATGVGVAQSLSNVNFFADQGFLQVTVVNNLDVPVHDVRLQLAPGNARLRVDGQPQVLHIARHSRTNVKFHVTAVAAGLVPIDARLRTANGTPVGRGAVLRVHVQPTASWVFWALGGLAGLVIVLGIARSLRRGRSRASLPSGENLLP